MRQSALALLLAAEALALRLRVQRLAESLVWMAAALLFALFLLVFLHLALYLGLAAILLPWQAALAVSGTDLLLLLAAAALLGWRWRRRSRDLAEAQALGESLRAHLLALLAPWHALLTLWLDESGRRERKQQGSGRQE
jgi:hypothetical protein